MRSLSHLKNPIVIGSAATALIIVCIGYWFISRPTQLDATFSPATTQALTETVSVSGTVTSASAVDLAFERSGKIASVRADVGDSVTSGETLVSLDAADLAAQLAGANATLASQQAKLASLQAGSRPEDIAVAQTAVTNANAAITNAETSMADKIQDAYTVSDQAILNTTDLLLNNPTTDPQLSFSTTNGQLAIDLENERPSIGTMLAAWNASIEGGTANDTDAKQHLDTIQDYLATAAAALGSAVDGSISPATIASWKASVAGAQTSLNAAYAAITAGEDAESSAQSALNTAQSQLAAMQAGSAPEDIAAQQAAVDGAQAAVAAVQAELSQTVIRAPESGVITKQDAHVGAVASPNVPLVSMISNAAFEIDASVSETEVGKIKPGDDVSVTLDAYGSSVAFPATVVSIDPSATTDNGVPSYRVVIQFTNTDDRIKAGMTANATIVTAEKQNVLAIPWNAVIERDNESIVVVKNPDGTTSERQIETGIRGGDLIEVVSGLSEGELVASYGTNQ